MGCESERAQLVQAFDVSDLNQMFQGFNLLASHHSPAFHLLFLKLEYRLAEGR